MVEMVGWLASSGKTIQPSNHPTIISMKIRIQGNSIRLRLSQSEVEKLGKTGKVEEQIQFGTTEAETLRYIVESTGVREMGATYADNEIKVFVPSKLVAEWVSTDLVSLDHEMSLGGGNTLRILVEKDFKCLTPRSGEDESDNFPNPNGNC